jgi:hypothetical protein
LIPLKDFYTKKEIRLGRNKMMKKIHVIAILIIFYLTIISGCIDENDSIELINLTKFKLTENDFEDEFKKGDEEYITQPYNVTEGNLFEGLKVYRKYEVLFLKNDTTFIIQQIAQLQSEDICKTLIDTLRAKNSIAGITEDWNFSDLEMQIIGDDSILKQNISNINNKAVTIYLSAFRIDNIVNIILTASLPKNNIIEYNNIVFDRITAI